MTNELERTIGCLACIILGVPLIAYGFYLRMTDYWDKWWMERAKELRMRKELKNEAELNNDRDNSGRSI